MKDIRFKQRGQGVKGSRGQVKILLKNGPSYPRILESLNPAKGFTLLEIMIALVIVGLVLIVTIHTVNYHAGVSYEHTLITQMALLAKEKIAEMESNPENKTGTLPDKNFSYETSAKNTEDDGIIEVKATVRGYGKEVVLSELIVKK